MTGSTCQRVTRSLLLNPAIYRRRVRWGRAASFASSCILEKRTGGSLDPTLETPAEQGTRTWLGEGGESTCWSRKGSLPASAMDFRY